MPDQYVLEYSGFSAARGRCHVVLDHSRSAALVGDPIDNLGTSVTNAIEQIASEIRRVLNLDVTKGRLYQYVPWDVRLRREYTAVVEFHGDAWSLPVWTEVEADDDFVVSALDLVRRYQPYALAGMKELPVVNAVIRVRIDAPVGADIRERISRLGTVEHISQRRFYYVDIAAQTEEEALAVALRELRPEVSPEHVHVTTPNAPLDQPGTLPI